MEQITQQVSKTHHNRDKELTQTQSLNYYRENPPKLPHHPQWRQYRYVDPEGEMHKIKKQIHKPRELQEILIQTTPIAVYYTHSQFLAPDKVKQKRKNNTKPGYLTRDNLFLDSDYVIDFDKEHSNLKNIKKTINILKGKMRDEEYIPREHWKNKPYGFKDLELRQTGNGYHIILRDFSEQYCKEKTFTNPANRENHHLHMKHKLTKTLKKSGCRFDYPISRDTRRIIRVPQTLHQNGSIIKKIDIKAFLNHMTLPERTYIN